MIKVNGREFKANGDLMDMFFELVTVLIGVHKGVSDNLGKEKADEFIAMAGKAAFNAEHTIIDMNKLGVNK